MTVWGKVIFNCAVVSLSTNCAVMRQCIRHLFGFYYRFVLWVCVLYQRSAGWGSLRCRCLHFSWFFLSVGSHVWSGVGVQLWQKAPAPHCLDSWVQTASTFMYKHAACHHALWLCWTAIIYVIITLYCAQYYCSLLHTASMNLAVRLGCKVPVLPDAQLCQAYIVRSLLE